MSQNRQPFHTSLRHQSVARPKVEVLDNEQPRVLVGWYEMWYTVDCAIVYNCVNINKVLGEELKGRTLSHLD